MPIASPTVQDQLPELTAAYRAAQFVHLPGLLSPERAAELVATTQSAAVRRVKCGDPGIAFGEQRFASEHPIRRLLATELAPLALALTSADRIIRLACWTLVYGPGEFINSHTDAEGSIHLVVCLQAPPTDTQGGRLILHPDTSAQVALELAPGDAVAFNAMGVRHRTTPLIASPDAPDPSRVVGVGRYFT
jgi:predicted 2-oxoglutarate/Fe(II)-dependent dioxygenase YbiX